VFEKYGSRRLRLYFFIPRRVFRNKHSQAMCQMALWERAVALAGYQVQSPIILLSSWQLSKQYQVVTGFISSPSPVTDGCH
jgi:hypothetical protein